MSWRHGNTLTEAQLLDAVALGYTRAEASALVWYITADEMVSRRHKPRQGGLDDRDSKLILTALVYLAHCPHLAMIVDASPDDIANTIERVQNELYGNGDTDGQG